MHISRSCTFGAVAFVAAVLASISGTSCRTASPNPPAPSSASNQPAGPSSSPRTAPTPPAPSDALGDLNSSFLAAYSKRQGEARNGAILPLIEVSGSSLILYRSKDTPPDNQRVIPDVYHGLKAVAHLPFTLYLELSPYRDQPLPSELVAALSGFPSRIAASRTQIATFPLTADQQRRQTAIFDKASILISGVLDRHMVTGGELANFAHDLGPLVSANASDAGCEQIKATHRQVMQWKALLTPEEWSRLRVMNRAPHQPRYRNAATQYFAWLLREEAPSWSYPGESMRTVYAEVLFGDRDARDLAATVQIDADASAAFFGDPWRLSEDILSDGAKVCIDNLAAPEP